MANCVLRLDMQEEHPSVTMCIQWLQAGTGQSELYGIKCHLISGPLHAPTQPLLWGSDFQICAFIEISCSFCGKLWKIKSKLYIVQELKKPVRSRYFVGNTEPRAKRWASPWKEFIRICPCMVKCFKIVCIHSPVTLLGTPCDYQVTNKVAGKCVYWTYVHCFKAGLMCI